MIEKVLFAEDGIVARETLKGFKISYSPLRDALTNVRQKILALTLLGKYSLNYLSEELTN